MFSSILISYAQKTYVLCVGIADYKSINDLRLSENDAISFNGLMKNCGAESTILVGSSATHENVISMLRGVLAKATSQDAVIFYFSGHGYEGGFCCWDMGTNSPAISSRNGVSANLGKTELNSVNRYFGGLSYAEIQVLFRNCRAGRKFVIADACFSGGLRKGNHLNTSVQSARNGDVIFFLSSRTDETSLEMPDCNNGLFTFYLINGLSGASDADSNNVITIRELFDYVHDNVSGYASKLPHNQHPVMWGKFNDKTPVIKIMNNLK